MTDKRILPPSYFLISIIIMGVLHYFLPLAEIIAFPWTLLGVVPLMAGIALNLVADNAFKKFNTTVKPFQESAALITSGVFQITRHPMYLGMVLILLGIAILTGTLSPFFVVPVFALVMEKIFICVEESMLAEKFGPGWQEYCSRVRRWI